VRNRILAGDSLSVVRWFGGTAGFRRGDVAGPGGGGEGGSRREKKAFWEVWLGWEWERGTWRGGGAPNLEGSDMMINSQYVLDPAGREGGNAPAQEEVGTEGCARSVAVCCS